MQPPPHDPSQLLDQFTQQLGPGFHLSALFDYLPEIYLYVKDCHSRFLKVNRALYLMRGFEAEQEMVGKTDFDVHPRYLAEQYVAEDRRVMEGGRPIPNQVWLVPDMQGRLKWFLSSKLPLFDRAGTVVGIAGVMRDLELAESMVRPYQNMEHVVKHVLEHYGEKLEVAELAKLAHLSVSQFDRRFKQLFQMTPQQYVLRVRLNAAQQLLVASSHSVAEIALRTGFYDQSYFTKQFRKHTGLTPRAFRKTKS